MNLKSVNPEYLKWVIKLIQYSYILWSIDSEPIRARGIIVKYLVKNIYMYFVHQKLDMQE